MNFLLTTFVTILITASIPGAEASTVTIGAVEAALGARDKSIAQISGPQLRSASQAALNAVVASGIAALRSNGNNREANGFEGEWNGQYSTYFTSIRSSELGDHRPLSKWLANFYDRLEERLGGTVIHQGVLGDIYLMNFAIPVVFAPKGEWRTTVTDGREWVEYRKHFIPFANIITYYASNIACNRYLTAQGLSREGKRVCAMISNKLKHAMGRYVAPKISDFIYYRANGKKVALDLTNGDLVYVSAEALAAEVDAESSNELSNEISYEMKGELL